MTNVSEIDHQISTLTEIVSTLTTTISHLSDRVDQIDNANKSHDHNATDDTHEPAPWVWFTPPTGAEDNPQLTVDNFVTWYNITYIGLQGSRATPIPDCWRQHPGLAMEIATLAHSWHAANLGPSANPREAQYWHHQWRPGFTDRLAREWVHTDCIDGDHRTTGVDDRPDRFTRTDQRPSAAGDDS